MITPLFRTAMSVVILFFAFSATPARAAEPLFTIIFTGNTYGNYEPCPS